MKSSNKRIAKNTIFLYIRNIVILFAALYTSRLLLKLLGDTDMGVFNLAGGIVALMAFFQSAQAKATGRFITYELGLGDNVDEIRNTFSICLTIHLMIVLVVLLLGESIGLWIVNRFIEIPASRYYSANFVYQCSLFILCVNLLRVPYDAVIMAYEEMSVYAYFSIFEAIAQLIIIILLQQLGGDSLVQYGISLSLLSISLFFLYYIYVRLKHKEYVFKFSWNKDKSIKILSFSGWTLIGSTANTATQQGLGLLLNKFIGIIANTALGFAYQVNAALTKFVSSFTMAFNPQIIKLYAKNDYDSLHLMMNRSSKFSFVLAFVMGFPLIVNMNYVLHLWLEHVPKFTTEFCQLILICAIIDALSGFLNTSITATGNIRKYQISLALSFCFDLLCSFLFLILGLDPVYVFGSRILTRGLLNMGIGLYFGKCLLKFNIRDYVWHVIIPVLLLVCFSSIFVYGISLSLCGISRLVWTYVTCFIIVLICTWLIICTKSEQRALKSMVRDIAWKAFSFCKYK